MKGTCSSHRENKIFYFSLIESFILTQYRYHIHFKRIDHPSKNYQRNQCENNSYSSRLP